MLLPLTVATGYGRRGLLRIRIVCTKPPLPASIGVSVPLQSRGECRGAEGKEVFGLCGMLGKKQGDIGFTLTRIIEMRGPQAFVVV